MARLINICINILGVGPNGATWGLSALLLHNLVGLKDLGLHWLFRYVQLLNEILVSVQVVCVVCILVPILGQCVHGTVV